MHKKAWERSKKWLCYWEDDDLKWISRPRKPFQRLVNTSKELQAFKKDVDFTVRMASGTEPWKGGLPPICLGMIGTICSKKAVVVDKIVKTTSKLDYVGIGDSNCLFKDFDSHNDVVHMGLQRIKTTTSYWVVQTEHKSYEIPLQSSRFKRSCNVIRDVKNNMARIYKHICEPVLVTHVVAARLSSPKQLPPLERKAPKECPVFSCEHIKKKRKY